MKQHEVEIYAAEEKILSGIIEQKSKKQIKNQILELSKRLSELQGILYNDFIIEHGLKNSEYLNNFDEYIETIAYWKSCKSDSYNKMLKEINKNHS